MTPPAPQQPKPLTADEIGQLTLAMAQTPGANEQGAAAQIIVERLIATISALQSEIARLSKRVEAAEVERADAQLLFAKHTTQLELWIGHIAEVMSVEDSQGAPVTPAKVMKAAEDIRQGYADLLTRATTAEAELAALEAPVSDTDIDHAHHLICTAKRTSTGYELSQAALEFIEPLLANLRQLASLTAPQNKDKSPHMKGGLSLQSEANEMVGSESSQGAEPTAPKDEDREVLAHEIHKEVCFQIEEQPDPYDKPSLYDYSLADAILAWMSAAGFSRKGAE